jgi:hypothetical protein
MSEGVMAWLRFIFAEHVALGSSQVGFPDLDEQSYIYKLLILHSRGDLLILERLRKIGDLLTKMREN